MNNSIKSLLSCAKIIPPALLVLFLISLFFSCSSEQKRMLAIQEAKEIAVRNYVASLEESERISQMFLVNIEGDSSFFPVEKTGALYGDYKAGKPMVPGGCLFFSYNIAKSKEEIQSFISSIRRFYKENGNVQPYLAIDQEGGYVNRLRGITSPFPSSKTVASTMTVEQAQNLYETQAAEMQELGFNMNLAPVVEVETPENEDFLDTRSFGTLEKVLQYAPIEINAFESRKIATVLKHFPGNTNTDPHTGLPELRVSREQLENTLLAPFRELLPLSSALLMSHARVFVSDHDDSGSEAVMDIYSPACLSSFWVSEVVRKSFGFDGLVLSDDIFMAALAKNGFPPEDAVVMAVEAGVDVIMLSEKRFGSVGAMLLKESSQSENFSRKIDEAVCRIIKYKIKAGILAFSQADFDETGRKLKTPAFSVESCY